MKALRRFMEILVAPTVGFTILLTVMACGEDLTGIEDPNSLTLTTPETTAFKPSKKHVKLEVQTYEKKCFGSAGCNVTFQVKVALVSPEKWDPDNIYSITYEVIGGEQRYISSKEISQGRYKPNDKETIQIASENSELKAKVTNFEKIS